MASASMEDARKEKKARRKRPVSGQGLRGLARRRGDGELTESAGQPTSFLVDKGQKNQGWPSEIVQMQAKGVQKADGLGR